MEQKLMCSTLADIWEKDGSIFIKFTDGSVRRYDDLDKEHYDHILSINGKFSIGSYYREFIRDFYEYEEVEAKTIDITINK